MNSKIITSGRTTAKQEAAKSVEAQKKNAPRPEEIQLRAYEIHLERGGVHGRDMHDWLQAEIELGTNEQTI
jgi:peptide deformylase